MLIRSVDLKSKYNYIIVGAGIVGMTILRELIEKGKENILIIDSGSFLSKSPYPDFMKLKSKKNNIKVKSRFSGVGGSSNVWGTITSIFDKKKIDDYFINKKFPLDYEKYTRYINKASKYGYPKLNEFSSSDLKSDKLKVKKFIKVKPNIRYYHFSSILESSKVCFLQNTIVKSIGENEIFLESNYKNQNLSSKADKIILCANTIENYKILSKSDLKINLKVLGKGFMNHPKGVIGVVKKNIELNNYISRDCENKSSYLGIQLKESDHSHYLKICQGFKIPALDYLMRFIDGNIRFYKNKFVGKNKTSNYIQFYFYKILKILSKILNKIFNNYYYIEAFTEMKMHVDNCISFDSNTGSTTVDYSLSNAELISLNKLVDEFENFFKLKLIFRPSTVKKLKHFVSNDASHHMGGIICGIDSKSSIVDLNLSLHNHKNIFICGGGIFPFSGVSNPTLSYIAVAIWLSEEIL